MATRAKKRGRLLGWAIAGCLALLLGGFFWWRSATGPLEHATLTTLVKDLQRARKESNGSINVYAYRLNSFLREALVGKPWKDAVQQLGKQGAELQGGMNGSATFDLPECGFTFPGGPQFETKVYVEREGIPAIAKPGELKVRGVRFELALVDPWSLKKPETAFPPGSVIEAHLKRPAIASVLKRLPRLARLSVNYVSDPTNRASGGLNVSMRLNPVSGKNDGGADIMTGWTSGLEANRKRFFSWLPLYYGASQDIILFSFSSNEGGRVERRTSYSLRRSDVSTAEPYVPDVEAISDADLGALPADCEGLTLPAQPPKDSRLLARFTNLKRVQFEGRADDRSLGDIAALPKLEKLFVSISSPRGLAILARSSRIEDLTLDAVLHSKGEIAALGSMKTLKSLRLYQRQPYVPELTATLGMLPNIETLWLSNAEGMDGNGIRNLAKAATIKDIFLRVTHVAPGELGALALFPSLERLRLTNANLDDKTIQMIASMKRLRSISFYSAKGLTGDKIVAFAKLPHLEAINFYRCAGVTDAALQKLRSKLGPKFQESPGE